MLNEENFNHLVEVFLLRNIKLRFNGELRAPTRDELKLIISDCVELIKEADESISIEIGHLLVKRTDNHIDVYAHMGEIEDD
jgi:hypothetical protein